MSTKKTNYIKCLLEQETIITFNRAEPTAYVYTHEPGIKNKLDYLEETNKGIFKLKEEDGASSYLVPKAIINFMKMEDTTWDTNYPY